MTTRAGAAAAASLPPLMAERCLRTQFISVIVAPDLSSARLTCCLSAKRQAGGGECQQCRGAARYQAEHEIIGREPAHRREDPRRRRRTRRVGHGMGGLDDLDMPGSDAMAVAGDDQARRAAPSNGASTARAMAAAALPAPTTTVRPLGAAGRNGGTQRAGSQAASAASNMRRSKARGAVSELNRRPLADGVASDGRSAGIGSAPAPGQPWDCKTLLNRHCWARPAAARSRPGRAFSCRHGRRRRPSTSLPATEFVPAGLCAAS